MPSAQLTFTGKTGPDRTLTAQVYTGVKNLYLDFDRSVVQLTDGNGDIQELDLAGRTVLTDTISGGNHTIVIS